MMGKAALLDWVSHDGMPILSVDIHIDGTRFVTTGTDGMIKIWQIPRTSEEIEGREGEPLLLATITGHNRAVNCGRFSPDGKYLATCGDDYSVLLHEFKLGPGVSSFGSTTKNVENWKTVDVSRVHKLDVVDLSWSPDSTQIASIGHDGVIAIHKLEDSKLRIKLTINAHQGLGKGVAWDPQNKYIASLGTDAQLCIHRLDGSVVKKEKKYYTKSSENMFFKRLTWSADGAYLLSVAALKNKVHAAPLYSRLHDWTNERELLGHVLPVSCARMNPNVYRDAKGGLFQVIALAGLDSTLSLWYTNRPKAAFVFNNIFGAQICDISWASDGRFLLASSADGKICMFQFDDADFSGSPLSRDEFNARVSEIYAKSNLVSEAAAGVGEIIASPATLTFEKKVEEKIKSEEQKKAPMSPPPKKTIQRDNSLNLESRFSDPSGIKSLGVLGSGAASSSSGPVRITLVPEDTSNGQKKRIVPEALGTVGTSVVAPISLDAAPEVKSAKETKEPKEKKKRKREDDDEGEKGEKKKRRKKEKEDEKEKPKLEDKMPDNPRAEDEEDLMDEDINSFDDEDEDEDDDDLIDDAADMEDEFGQEDSEEASVDTSSRRKKKPSKKKKKLTEVEPMLTWLNSSEQLLRFQRNLIPIPSQVQNLKSLHTLLPEIPFKESPASVEVLIGKNKSELNVSRQGDGERLCSLSFDGEIATAVLVFNDLIALGFESGYVHLLDRYGKYLLPSVVLGEGAIVSFQFVASHNTLAVLTASGQLFLWKLAFSPFDVVDAAEFSIIKLVDRGVISVSEADRDGVIFHSIDLDHGVPIVTMRSGAVYKYHPILKQWLSIVDPKALTQHADSVKKSQFSSNGPVIDLEEPSSLASLSMKALSNQEKLELLPSLKLGAVLKRDLENSASSFIRHCEQQLASTTSLSSSREHAYWEKTLVSALVKNGDVLKLQSIFDKLLEEPEEDDGASPDLAEPSLKKKKDEKEKERERLKALLPLLRENRRHLQPLFERYEKYLG